VKLKRKINLTKGQKNQNNEDQIRKKNDIINWNWMMKLKTSQNFIKWSRTKIKNKKIRTKLKKIAYHKLRLNDKIENQLKLYKKTNNKN